MAILFSPPFYRATDSSNAPISGAFLSFYQTQTSTPQPIWADVGLMIPLANPMPADAEGNFPPIWLDDRLPAYKVVAQIPDSNDITQPGAILWTLDPYTDKGQGVTVAELAANVIPNSFLFDESDIRRYGASLTATDNSAALNAAANVCNNGGNAVFIPPGTWPITSAFVLTGQASVYGMGASSILAPNGCDGIQLGNNGGLGVSRFVQNFQILGTNTAANKGISCNFTAASGQRASGVVISNITARNFGDGGWFRGLWQSVIKDCFFFNCYRQINFQGQSTVVLITGGFYEGNTGAGAITGTGSRYGVLSEVVDGENLESLQLQNTNLYNVDVFVSLDNALSVMITNNDFSICGNQGIQITGARGGLVIADNYLQSGASVACTLIQLLAQSTAILDKVVIRDNTLFFIPDNSASIGIDVQQGVNGVTIDSNTIGSDFGSQRPGIPIIVRAGANNVIIDGNTLAGLDGSGVSAGSLSQNLTMTNNILTTPGMIPVVFDTLTPAGFALTARGTFVLTLSTGASATVPWIANGHEIIIQIGASGISSSVSATAITASGLPAWLWPNVSQLVPVNVLDNGGAKFGTASISATTGVMTLGADQTGAAFTTGTSVKGLNTGLIRYALG